MPPDNGSGARAPHPRSTFDAARSRRNMAKYERETEERKLCVCRHVRREHAFGKRCEMRQCRCEEFEAA